MLWNSKHDIKMVTMISNHERILPNSLFSTKIIRCTQKVKFKDRNWRHPDADFVIWVVGGHLGFTQNGDLRCCKMWTPWFYHSFVSIDISTLTAFGDSNLANPISVTCQPPTVTANIQCHVNGQHQGTGIFVIKKKNGKQTHLLKMLIMKMKLLAQ